ncbi:hypothetical protein EUX98_g5685 [Antrodiella citrinella]|uniref:Uncharacterized protein n=1 Tax=Antrodiella citrinella TaxID=2447956 RepID=A0A4S4MQV0_9APHY|nr:hypothetical protein EUX98_g5685 [Antrodiella citrinella]
MMPPYGPFTQLMNMFATIERLDIQDVSAMDRSYSDYRMSVEELEAAEGLLKQAASEAKISDAVRIKKFNSEPLLALRTLDIVGENGPLHRRLLCVVGHNLVRLHISLKYPNPVEESTQDRHGLSHCTALSTLQITFSYTAQIQRVGEELRDIVIHVPSSLTRFRVHITCDHTQGPGSLNALPWDTLDKYLSRRTRALADVTINIVSEVHSSTYPPEQDTEFSRGIAFVREKLPRLKASKILTVSSLS